MLSFARVRALAILVALVVGAIVTVILALGRDTDQPVTQECPAGWPVADLTLREERDVSVNIYNVTGQSGLASQVATHLSNRDFNVLDHGDDPREDEVEGVALLRYGPAGVGSAQLLRAYFLNEATTEFDIEREDDTVDVVLGPGFRQLATPTEVRQAIAAIGHPVLPPETCPDWDD